MNMELDVRNAQLFLDDGAIEQAVRLKRVVHRPTKFHGNPVYQVGAPWEGAGVIYLGGVYIDPADGFWKAWYVTLNPPQVPDIVYAVCLIVSRDGIRWERPELDVYRMPDGTWTNIVLDLGPAGRTTAPTIIHEPASDEPWTMFISLAWPADSTHYRGYFLKSEDGVHWRWVQERPEGFDHGFHDRTTAALGPDPDFPYVLIGRGKEDIYRWSLPRAAHRISASLTGTEPGEPSRVILPGLEDEPEGQIYHAHAFPYKGVWIGLFQWYWEVADPWGEMELLFSRDTRRWQRIRPHTPFLSPSSDDSAFDSRITDTALSPPIRTGGGDGATSARGIDALWFYYWGGPSMHGNRHLTYGRAMGMAQLRLDGFCSLRTGMFPGVLTTKPFAWPGGELSINASTLGGSGGGTIRAEVLTEDLTPIDGFGFDESVPFTTDSVRHAMGWNGGETSLESLSGRRIRFRFHLERAELFSFRSTAGD